MPPKTRTTKTSSKGVAKVTRKTKKGTKQATRTARKGKAAPAQRAAQAVAVQRTSQQQSSQPTTTQQQPADPIRDVTTFTVGNRNQNLGWTVSDPSAPTGENWNNGRPLAMATIPGTAVTVPVGRRNVRYKQDEITINIGDWITVHYKDEHKSHGQPPEAREFANVRAIRRVGAEDRWPMYTLLCVSWGYPLSYMSSNATAKIGTGQGQVHLNKDDIVLTDHLDIIYLDNVADVVDEPSPLLRTADPFDEVIETMDMAKKNGKGNTVVRLCSSRWFNIKAVQKDRTLSQGTIQSEVGNTRRPGRIYSEVPSDSHHLPTRRVVMRHETESLQRV
ncbi:hypothetical protein BDZ85DRAFT_281036 [Elsinoe ampelina]|uniref:Uncharacterized protein n=1 Tax=Elsinoe ampelina TaxID=302913 RepID=A0A6A6GFL3_9PEZI|nr:hypothetical protein BDZ85DRAFT_281036 [Elsinoe ampelina]